MRKSTRRAHVERVSALHARQPDTESATRSFLVRGEWQCLYMYILTRCIRREQQRSGGLFLFSRFRPAWSHREVPTSGESKLVADGIYALGMIDVTGRFRVSVLTIEGATRRQGCKPIETRASHRRAVVWGENSRGIVSDARSLPCAYARSPITNPSATLA